MVEISLFAEDHAHDIVLSAMIARVAQKHQCPFQLRKLSVTGGAARAESEFAEYVQDVLRHRLSLPDAIVVGRDSNCQGYRRRRRALEQVAGQLSDRVIYAIPDPHIERWLLLQPAAFKKALGVACRSIKHKCERVVYKEQLMQEVQRAGLAPILGGLEHAEEIVGHMNLNPKSARDDLTQFLEELHQFFRNQATQSRS